MSTKGYDYEEMLDKLKEIVEANLPSEIDLINAEKGDNPMTHPVGYWYGIRLVDPKIEKGKSVVQFDVVNIEGTNFNPGLTDEEVFLIVNLVAWESKPEVLTRKIMRYAKALRNVIDNNPITDAFSPPADNIGDAVVSGIEWSFPDFSGRTYQRAVTIRLRVRDEYTYQ